MSYSRDQISRLLEAKYTKKSAVLAYLIFVIFREKKLKMFIYGQGSKFHICGGHDTVPRPQPAS